jgi:hypothetical protein
MSNIKRRKKNYIEVIESSKSKNFNYSKMYKLLINGNFKDFSAYANEFKMGEDFIQTAWNKYRIEKN